MEDDQGAITSLATVRLQAKSRLLVTACCPDKDLVVLISRVGGNDKLSLWKMQGTKKWEVDLSHGDNVTDDVTALNWSPDGQTIVVAHYPPRISLHSLQNGREEHSFDIFHPASSSLSLLRITSVWWFQKEKRLDKKEMPDIFKRGNVVPGSALSILKTQPLLVALQDDTVPLNATDLFAFQGSQARSGTKILPVPKIVSSWPSLPSDPLAASICPAPREGEKKPGEKLDEKDLTNVDSLLVAIDSSGLIHCFLDGSYPLGAINLASGCEAKAVMRNHEENTLLVHAEVRPQEDPATAFRSLVPLVIELPLLYAKSTRHVAENSSAARELVWYAMRVVKEMKKVWFGGDGHGGARDFNANFVRGLEERQARFDQERNAVFDLTGLLATGKSSPALSDFNQTGDLTSERGLQKWDTAVSEGLLKLRDYSEMRVAPVLQRLYLLLEEVRGWSLLPQLYGRYGFSTEEVDACLDLTARGIILSTWLAAKARSELYRFVEFQVFLRHETSRLSASEAASLPRYDILAVNDYLMSGLVVSSIDKWFIGPVPQFPPDDIAPVPETTDLRSAIDHARKFISDPANLKWPPITQKKDLSHLDRNLDALVHALAEKCQQVYDRAAKAVTRTASVEQTWSIPAQIEQAGKTLRKPVYSPSSSNLVRTRAVREEKSGVLTEHVAIRLQEGAHRFSRCREVVCIIRASYQHEGGSRAVSSVSVAMFGCKSQIRSDDTSVNPEASDGDDFHIFDMDFFDEESLVIVYQSYAEEGPENIGTVDYSSLEYLGLDLREYVKGLWQEDIVAEAIAKVSTGELACSAAPIRKYRALKLTGTADFENAEKEGRPCLAANGRAGRRVACVLDGEGVELEMVDMEGEGDAEEEE